VEKKKKKKEEKQQQELRPSLFYHFHANEGSKPDDEWDLEENESLIASTKSSSLSSSLLAQS
jgi:hypothetical protein